MNSKQRRDTPLQTLAHSHFCIVVEAVFCGDCLHGLSRGTELPHQNFAKEILSLFEDKAHRVVTLWSFFVFLHTNGNQELLQTFFQSCPPFLHFFIHAVGGSVSSRALEKKDVIEDLTEMKEILENDQNFYLSFANGERDDDVRRNLSINLSNMKEKFANLIDSFNNRRVVSLKDNEEKAKKALREFLTGKGFCEQQINVFFNKYYKNRWAIYSASVCLLGLETFLLTQFALADLVSVRNALSGGKGPDARLALSEACFKSYIEFLVQKTGIESPIELAEKLYEKLKHVVKLLNHSDNTLEKKQMILSNVTFFIAFSLQLLKEGTSPEELFPCIDKLLYNKDPDVFLDHWTVDLLACNLGSTHPNMKALRDSAQKGIQSERDAVQRPFTAKKQATANRANKIRTALQNNPFLLISHLVPSLIQALLPKVKLEKVNAFKRMLLLCKEPFERSPLANEFRDIVNLLISEPLILAGLGATDSLSFVQEYFRNLRIQLNDLLNPIAKGEALLGNSLTEKEISELIEEILLIRTVKNDPTQLTKRQAWLIENVPNLSKEISDLSNTLSRLASFQSLITGAMQVITWAAGTALNVMPSLKKQAEKPVKESPELKKEELEKVGQSIVSAPPQNSNGLWGFFTNLIPDTASKDKAALTPEAKEQAEKPAQEQEEKTEAKEEDPQVTIWSFISYFLTEGNVTKKELAIIEPAIRKDVIPLVMALIPVIEKNHALASYSDFFKNLDVIIKSSDTSAETIEFHRKQLTQLIASVATQSLTEIGQYEETIIKVYGALLSLESVPQAFSLEHQRVSEMQTSNLLLSAPTTIIPSGMPQPRAFTLSLEDRIENSRTYNIGELQALNTPPSTSTMTTTTSTMPQPSASFEAPRPLEQRPQTISAVPPPGKVSKNKKISHTKQPPSLNTLPAASTTTTTTSTMSQLGDSHEAPRPLEQRPQTIVEQPQALNTPPSISATAPTMLQPDNRVLTLTTRQQEEEQDGTKKAAEEKNCTVM